MKVLSAGSHSCVGYKTAGMLTAAQQRLAPHPSFALDPFCLRGLRIFTDTWCLLLCAMHSRPNDLRYYAEKYGSVKDVYLPKDYHTG